jgi:hypothetical protein
MTDRVLVISNLEPGDDTYTSDRGSWNVTRAKRDCADGRHKRYAMNVADILTGSRNIEFDPAKVDDMVIWLRRHPTPPLIFVVEDGMLWLIDGIHRVRALSRLGRKQCVGFVIEENKSQRYRVMFNGERHAPWDKDKYQKPL